MSMLILYTPDREKEQNIILLSKSLSVTVRLAGPEDADRTVAEMLGLPDGREKTPLKAPAPGTLPEFMIFSGLIEGELDRFLSEYRRAGIPGIALKAVTTIYNFSWTLTELLSELEKEREAVEGKH